MNIGIFSGTFDPVHKGHIWLAREVSNRLSLDKVALLPEAKPRRKTPRATFQQRKEMLNIATGKDSKIEVLDAPRSSHGVVDTLNFVDTKYDEDANVTIMLGADVFMNIRHWDDFERLKKRVDFAVFLRQSSDKEKTIRFAEEQGLEIITLSSDYASVSSSTVRQTLSKNLHNQPKGLNTDVYNYIRINKIYGIK